jgi:hypothetical protein
MPRLGAVLSARIHPRVWPVSLLVPPLLVIGWRIARGENGALYSELL